MPVCVTGADFIRSPSYSICLFVAHIICRYVLEISYIIIYYIHHKSQLTIVNHINTQFYISVCLFKTNFIPNVCWLADEKIHGPHPISVLHSFRFLRFLRFLLCLGGLLRAHGWACGFLFPKCGGS